MTARPGEAIVLYDADCGWCRWTLAKFLRWDGRRVLSTLAIQSPAAEPFLGDMPMQQRLASWHLVTPDGRLHSGGAVFPPLLRLLPGGAPLAAVASALPGPTERTYRWIAGHRRLLSRPLRRRSIARADCVVAQRSRPTPGGPRQDPLR